MSVSALADDANPALCTPIVRAKPADLTKAADARRLFELEQLDVSWDESAGALWTFMRPRGRPSYNPDFLEDFQAWQRGISAMFADRPHNLRYLLLGSHTPGVFRRVQSWRRSASFPCQDSRAQSASVGCLRRVLCADFAPKHKYCRGIRE
jgi:hypothetical protein